MGIPYAKTYHVTERGVALRTVTCEHCSTEFVYALARETTGQGTSVLFLDNAGAQEKAAADAEAELAKQLAADVDPVPCPNCQLYQEDMVSKLREGAYWWVDGLAVLSALLAIIVGAILLSVLLFNSQNFSTGMRIGMAIVIVGGAAGCFGLTKSRKSLCKSYDPNSNEFADRRRSCKQSVMLKVEFEKAGPDALLAPVQKAHANSAWSDQRFNFYVRFALTLLFSVGSLVILVVDSKKIANCIASNKWPTANASVVSAFVKTESVRHKNRDVMYYSPAITYQYEVAGKKYTGDTVQFEPPKSPNQFEVNSIVNEVPAGTEIEVRYNPSNPAASVIIPGFAQSQLIYYVVLACVVVGGLGFFAFDIWRYLKLRNEFLSLDPPAEI